MEPAEPRAQRRLAAILAADVVGFSALMSKDEEGTHRRIKALEREVISPTVQEHHGRIVKTTGDGFLIEFGSPVEAVRCALSVQKRVADGPLQLRIGINLGDVIIEQDGDVYGEGVNVAARLEAKFQIGEYGEAVTALERAGSDAPARNLRELGWRVAAYAHLGRPMEAQHWGEELVRGIRTHWHGSPDAGPADYMDWVVWSSLLELPGDQERLRDGLRKAGLPA